jgi:hypothetical protein
MGCAHVGKFGLATPTCDELGQQKIVFRYGFLERTVGMPKLIGDIADDLSMVLGYDIAIGADIGHVQGLV